MRLFTAVYHEPGIFDYPLGRKLKRDFADLPWHEIKSHNRIEEMTLDDYKSAAFITDEKVTEKKISDYRMVTVGDTQPDEIGMHNYAVLLVDVKNKVVKGYAPTK